jgi:hypothetical protein
MIRMEWIEKMEEYHEKMREKKPISAPVTNEIPFEEGVVAEFRGCHPRTTVGVLRVTFIMIIILNRKYLAW